MRLVAALVPLSLAGCVVIAAVVVGGVLALGTYKYVNNELHRDYETDYEAAWNAANKAVVDLGFHAVDARKDFARAVIDCRRADDTPVQIVLEKVNAKTVHLAIRVGAFESESHREAAEAIHRRIYRNLGGK